MQFLLQAKLKKGSQQPSCPNSWYLLKKQNGIDIKKWFIGIWNGKIHTQATIEIFLGLFIAFSIWRIFSNIWNIISIFKLQRVNSLWRLKIPVKIMLFSRLGFQTCENHFDQGPFKHSFLGFVRLLMRGRGLGKERNSSKRMIFLDSH